MSQIILTSAEVEAANHVLFMETSKYGYPPGTFFQHIIRAMQHADFMNLARLLGAFPVYSRPVNIMRSLGSDVLAEIVKRSTQEGGEN